MSKSPKTTAKLSIKRKTSFALSFFVGVPCDVRTNTFTGSYHRSA